MAEFTKQSILVTRPDYDTVTHYLYAYAQPVVEAGRNSYFKVIDLEGRKATRKNFESYIEKGDVCFVFFNGHGNKREVAGHNSEVIISSGNNEKILKSTVVYSIACGSADMLGDRAVEAGAISYVGYSDDFVFLVDNNKITRPLEDELAKYFLAPSTFFATAVVKGKTISEAYDKAKGLLLDNFQRALSNEESDMAGYLWWDYNIFVAKGNTSARLNDLK